MGPSSDFAADAVHSLGAVLRAMPCPRPATAIAPLAEVLRLAALADAGDASTSQELAPALGDARDAACSLALRIASSAPSDVVLQLSTEPFWSQLKRVAARKGEPTVTSRKAAKAVTLVRRARGQG
mmetsp:Transcript_25893/g.81069  ORF Transcript_25893/g.81069 Transcript_25893/m.81069 type:complete len:126 (-) Transcript_25893:47-424(-)